MKVSLFAIRTDDLENVGIVDGAAVIKMKVSDPPLPVYRIDTDLPTNFSGRVSPKCPVLEQALENLRGTVVKYFGFDNGSPTIERGKLLKELLLSVETKSDDEVRAAIAYAAKVKTFGGIVGVVQENIP